jgi:hypothetical protein
MDLGDATGAIPVLDPQRKALFDAYLATPFFEMTSSRA